MDHFLPWDDFLFFSLSNDLDDYLFFPARPSATAAGVVFVNTPQKCCEQGQGQEAPCCGLTRIPCSCYCHPIADHRHRLAVLFGDPGILCSRENISQALPAGQPELWVKQCNYPILGKRKQAGLQTGEGADTQDVWFAEPWESTFTRRPAPSRGAAIRSVALLLNLMGTGPKKAQPLPLRRHSLLPGTQSPTFPNLALGSRLYIIQNKNISREVSNEDSPTI